MVIFCTVNYKDYSSTNDYIESYISLDLEDSILVVFDNEVDIKKHNFFKHKYINHKNIIFLYSLDNLGYFGAAFKSLDYVKKVISTFDYFCITNNDITFDTGSNWLDVLNEYSNEKVGCIAPSIFVKGTCIDQNPFHIARPNVTHYLKFHYLFKSFILTNFAFTFRHFLLKNRLIHRGNNVDDTIIKSKQEPKQIYAAQGAFFILSNNFLKSGYNINNLPFLYSEEISVAEHCQKKGLSIIYEPRLIVYHNEHQATGSSMSKFKFMELKKSVKFILESFY